MIDDTLEELITTSPLPLKKLLDVMEINTPLSAIEIMDELNIKSKETLRSAYLDPAIKQDLVKLTIPDKPTSKNQKYYKL